MGKDTLSIVQGPDPGLNKEHKQSTSSHMSPLLSDSGCNLAASVPDSLTSSSVMDSNLKWEKKITCN